MLPQSAICVMLHFCQRGLKIPHFSGRKFPTPEPHEWASLASDAVEPSAVFWRVLGATEAEAKELEAAARSCSRGGTQSRLAAVFQPIALPTDVDGRRVMQQPIQNRGRDDWIAEDRSPVPVALVRGQDDAAGAGRTDCVASKQVMARVNAKKPARIAASARATLKRVFAYCTARLPQTRLSRCRL